MLGVYLNVYLCKKSIHAHLPVDSQGGHSCIIPARQEDGSSRYQKHLGVPRFSARIVPHIVVFCFFMWLRSRFFLDNYGLIPFITGNDLWLKFFRFVGWYPPSNHHSCEHQPTKNCDSTSQKWAYPQMMVGLWRQLWLYTQRLSWIPQSVTCYPFICRGSRIMYFLFVSQLFNSFVPRVYTIICP